MAGKGVRRGRSNLPACPRRTGRHRRVNAQQQHGGSGHFRREREAAAGGQVKSGHPAMAFENHGGQTTAAQRIAGGAQQVERVSRQAEQAAVGITAEGCPAIALHDPGRAGRMARSQPEHRTRGGFHADRQGSGKAGGSRRIRRGGGIDFVQLPPRQTTAQHSINCVNPGSPDSIRPQMSRSPPYSGHTPPYGRRR